MRQSLKMKRLFLCDDITASKDLSKLISCKNILRVKKSLKSEKKRPLSKQLLSLIYRKRKILQKEKQRLEMVQGGRVTLIVLACQPGWEEVENLRGNLRNFQRKFERKWFRMKSAWEEAPQLNSPCLTEFQTWHIFVPDRGVFVAMTLVTTAATQLDRDAWFPLLIPRWKLCSTVHCVWQTRI